jgi:transmembrane sensor
MGAARQAADGDQLLSDTALREALQASAASGRLSDDDVRALRTARRRLIASAATAMLILTVGIGGWQQWGGRPLTEAAPTLRFATAPGEMRLVELADGSSLQLSGGTRVDVTLGVDHREAQLTAGEVYFDVVHDPSRSFSVRTGDTDVRVLGTAFDLSRTGDQVGLAVYRGAVRFASTTRGVVVKAGYRAHYRQGHTDGPVRFDPTLPDWRLGWLDTEGMKLADLIAVLSRQTGVVIEAPPAALADVAVSGRFRLDNAEQLLTAIGSVDGFTVRPEGKALKIVLIS